ncbi:MAG: hypothetical protein JKY93_04225 [Gammaproteobacteria bacterium]|nr:hypothetical protein [Gammaproteobacteria bacterium]
MADNTNPYLAPEANEANTTHSAGGTLEDGVAGNYDFEIMAVIKEAWDKTSGMKAPFWGAALIIGLGLMVLMSLLSGILGIAVLSGNAVGGMGLSLVIQIIITALLYPFMAGIIMLGVRRSVDLPITYTQAFGYFGKTIPLVIAATLITIGTMLGFMLLIIPGIYLSIAWLLTIPLIVEKDMGSWSAMEASRKAVTKHWFKVFFTYFLMVIIYLISVIPFGLGLIWTLPMMMNVGGILYRTMFGVEEARALQA